MSVNAQRARHEMIAEGVAVPDPSGHIEIVLVEDNPTDAELCLRSLKGHNLANKIVWLGDGAEALDYLFSRGAYSGGSPPRSQPW